MKIIPAMDIYRNKITRLSKGDFNTAVFYGTSPLDMALDVEQHGFDWMHMVDLEGAKTGEPSVLGLLEQIKTKTKLKIEFGGGIRNSTYARKVMDAGADRIVVGSVSVTDRKEFSQIVNDAGADNIIAAADINGEHIAVKGWLETSQVTLDEYIVNCMADGISIFLCTDISKDGMLGGANYQLYERLLQKYDIKLIASGGVKDAEDLVKLKQLNLYGAVVGKALYENKTNLKELAAIGQ